MHNFFMDTFQIQSLQNKWIFKRNIKFFKFFLLMILAIIKNIYILIVLRKILKHFFH